MFGLDLDFLELRQRPQAQVEDSFGLDVRKLELGHQLGLGLILAADNADDFIDIEIGDQIAIKHFEPVLDLFQAILRAAHKHFDAVLKPLR